MAADVGLDLRACQIGRVQRVARRHRRHPEEGMVLVHEIPAAAVDREVAPHLLRERPLIVLQLFVERQAFRIALPPVHPLEVPAGDHQLIDHLALPQGQSHTVERHRDRLEASQPLVEIRCRARQCRWPRAGIPLRHDGRRGQRRDDHCRHPVQARHEQNCVTAGESLDTAIRVPGRHARLRSGVSKWLVAQLRQDASLSEGRHDGWPSVS